MKKEFLHGIDVENRWDALRPMKTTFTNTSTGVFTWKNGRYHGSDKWYRAWEDLYILAQEVLDEK